MDLVDHHSFLGLDLLLRKCREGGKLEKKGSRLAEVFLEHCRVENDLLLGGERVKLPAQTVEVAVYCRSTSLLRAFEYGMFGEMGYSAMVACLIPCPAFDAEGTISHGRTASFDGIL